MNSLNCAKVLKAERRKKSLTYFLSTGSIIYKQSLKILKFCVGYAVFRNGCTIFES